jgi:large subunit ribosomal protein L10
MSKAIKQLQMDDLKRTFESVRDMILLNVVGLGAIPDNKLRLDLRKKGIRMQVVKNSLARRVFTDLGLQVGKTWEGSTTVAWGGTSIAALAKEIETVVKRNDKLMKVKTAVADGQEVAFDVALKMPTREEAIGRLLGLALSAHASLLGALKSPVAVVVGQLKAIEEKNPENTAAPPA